jgi:hypothetical protein
VTLSTSKRSSNFAGSPSPSLAPFDKVPRRPTVSNSKRDEQWFLRGSATKSRRCNGPQFGTQVEAEAAVQGWWDKLRGAVAQGASVSVTPLTKNTCERKYLRSLNVLVGVHREDGEEPQDSQKHCGDRPSVLPGQLINSAVPPIWAKPSYAGL